MSIKEEEEKAVYPPQETEQLKYNWLLQKKSGTVGKSATVYRPQCYRSTIGFKCLQS